MTTTPTVLRGTLTTIKRIPRIEHPDGMWVGVECSLNTNLLMEKVCIITAEHFARLEAMLRGYAAADIAQDGMIENARAALEPYGKREGHTKEWWQGYFQGCVGAHCMNALGASPDGPGNQESINEILAKHAAGGAKR